VFPLLFLQLRLRIPQRSLLSEEAGRPMAGRGLIAMPRAHIISIFSDMKFLVSLIMNNKHATWELRRTGRSLQTSASLEGRGNNTLHIAS
jgi:hypothetical protein